jgi:phosphohistidine phosphatase SixA
MSKKIFLVRHAENSGASLSDAGKRQAVVLAQAIKREMGSEEPVIIWTSTADRAMETTEIIRQNIQPIEAEIITQEKLWSDGEHRYDFDWLKKMLGNFTGETLIIVSHKEYVQRFPEEIGFPENEAEYAQGVLIQNERCTKINFN